MFLDKKKLDFYYYLFDDRFVSFSVKLKIENSWNIV